MTSFSTLGDAILSLGTSTTFLLDIPPSKLPPARFTTSHLLAHPAHEDASIAMLCYKNGALAREQVRDLYASTISTTVIGESVVNGNGGNGWAKFNEAIESTRAGNDGYSGFYFPLKEIIPDGVHGNFFFKDTLPVEDIPERAHPRAILESQFLSVKSRVAAVLPPDISAGVGAAIGGDDGEGEGKKKARLGRLVLTGGSSANETIRQLAADVFGLPTYVSETKEAAGHGGAVLAMFAWWRQERGKESGKKGGAGDGDGFSEFKAGIEENMRLVAEPRPEVTKVYEALVERYRACEEQVVDACAGRQRF